MSETEAENLRTEDRIRLQDYGRNADVAAAVEVLRSGRERILQRWLRAVERQPFHLGRPERAVTDDVPALFDALLVRLSGEPTAPQRSIASVADAARAHAHTRAAQGLLSTEIILEFRLLRQEVFHALRERPPAGETVGDLLAVQLLLGDALDEAIGVAVDYFTDSLESAKDDFIAIAAHDLRTPLTVLKGTVQLVSRQRANGTLTVEGLGEELAAIESAAGRIEQLLNTLLDVTRVRAGRIEIEPKPTNLATIVEHVIDLLGEEACRRVHVDIGDGALIGNWEPSRVEQVMENLLSNALKYAPTGPIAISLTRVGQAAVIEIRDRGIGLSPEDRAGLFQRFYRSPEAIERKIEGTGLGLYICRGIVEAHGGTILVTSAGKGKGTAVRVTLPLQGPTAGPLAPQPPFPQS